MSSSAVCCSFHGRYSSFSLAFLLFHSAILKPDFNLCLVQFECSGHLDSPRPCEVFVKVELLFQLGELLRSEICANNTLLSMASVFSDLNCEEGEHFVLINSNKSTCSKFNKQIPLT